MELKKFETSKFNVKDYEYDIQALYNSSQKSSITPREKKLRIQYQGLLKKVAQTQKLKYDLVGYDVIERGVITGTGIILGLIPITKVHKAYQVAPVPLKKQFAKKVIQGIKPQKSEFFSKVKDVATTLFGFTAPVWSSLNPIAKAVNELDKKHEDQMNELAEVSGKLINEISHSEREEEEKRREIRKIEDKIEEKKKQEFEWDKWWKDRAQEAQDWWDKITKWKEDKDEDGKVSAQAVTKIKKYSVMRTKALGEIKIAKANIKRSRQQRSQLNKQKQEVRYALQSVRNRRKQILTRTQPPRKFRLTQSATGQRYIKNVFKKDEDNCHKLYQLHRHLFGNKPLPIKIYKPLPQHHPRMEALVKKIAQKSAREHANTIMSRLR